MASTLLYKGRTLKKRLMEKILIAIDGKYGAWEALSHACSLAQRMEVQLNVLLVTPQTGEEFSLDEKKQQQQVQNRLSLCIEQAVAEGIDIKCFFTEGNYVEEVINFTNQNNITLLISEQTMGRFRQTRESLSDLHSLRHRITCRMEVVTPKKNFIH